ncbi:hypothetical protein CEXT_174851 [Caerostris extrusa]|uniref:Uncharacterized protein n=1 Tax=Caerostris extrusa TaxID=172846 RepID=A0AAV4U379_CAEEX|nr:hypothetical protein CEXT_174851 [Caerostris extrusa]
MIGGEWATRVVINLSLLVSWTSLWGEPNASTQWKTLRTPHERNVAAVRVVEGEPSGTSAQVRISVVVADTQDKTLRIEAVEGFHVNSS